MLRKSKLSSSDSPEAVPQPGSETDPQAGTKAKAKAKHDAKPEATPEAKAAPKPGTAAIHTQTRCPNPNRAKA